ncbi:hypothetical protein [Streptomyces halstedii]|uniref:hypothetical protein n=1 Tax=Streptomyces halstedii TaxID=1944 RepID=UPI003460547B
MLLHLQRGLVLRIALDPLRGLDLVRGLAAEAGVAGREGVADRGEARAGDRDLGAGRLREFAQLPGVGHQALAPVAEGGSGLALPVDGPDEVAEFLRGVVEGGAGVPEGLSGLFELLRVGVLDQVDHRVEFMALEGGPPRGTRAPEAERLHDALELPGDVRDDELALDSFLILLSLFLRCQLRLRLVTHQLSPRSS